MKQSGFIARQSYKMKFSDLPELFFAGILLRKIINIDDAFPQIIQLSLLDIFPVYKSLAEIETEIAGKKILAKDRHTEYLTDAINFLFKSKFIPKEEEVDILRFYNFYIERKLHFLLNGDNVVLEKCIEGYETDCSAALHSFNVTVIPAQFSKVYSKNIFSGISFNEKMYAEFKDKANDIGWGMSYNKQIELALEYFNERQKTTSEHIFDFNLRELTFRHLLSYVEDDNERLVLPAPLANRSTERILTPFFLETIGVLDVNGFKISSPVTDTENIELIFSVTKPAVRNKFLAKAYGLSAEQRRSLSETQIEIYERLFKKLFEKASFAGRPEMEAVFCKLFYWLLKKITYCLEEPSFLKEKADKWLSENEDKKYTQMEDNFFLPFLHEKLKDEFGEVVIKKPERFGGEIDLLFADIPVELKVRKNESESLGDCIDDNYKPAGQAATYAAITRLGFVVVLDLPRNDKKITNLGSCIQIISKEFSEHSLSTQIVVCIFHCNLPKPSTA